jgi:two-component system sensor histidine kinase/response regulator
LNAIIGFTGTLLMGLPGTLTTDQDTQLRTIQTSAKHLLSLINDLLDLAKIESGEVELHCKPVDCQSVLEEVANALRPLAEGKGLTLAFEVPAQACVVQTDHRALSQILINLTNNAIKFTAHGEVRLQLYQHQDISHTLTTINLIDTGVGIRQGDQQKLFEAFSQVDSSERHRHEGTGLGLYLSQKLASLLRGSISFHSEFGKGSTFTVTLSSA